MFYDMNCKIFIDTDLELAGFQQRLEKLLTVKFDEYLEAERNALFLRIVNNKFYDQKKSECFTEGFLYYKYHLEIECDDVQLDSRYVNFLSTLLLNLWSSEGMRAVASCDFEEFLPYQGGYQSFINHRAQVSLMAS